MARRNVQKRGRERLSGGLTLYLTLAALLAGRGDGARVRGIVNKKRPLQMRNSHIVEINGIVDEFGRRVGHVLRDLLVRNALGLGDPLVLFFLGVCLHSERELRVAVVLVQNAVFEPLIVGEGDAVHAKNTLVVLHSHAVLPIHKLVKSRASNFHHISDLNILPLKVRLWLLIVVEKEGPLAAVAVAESDLFRALPVLAVLLADVADELEAVGGALEAKDALELFPRDGAVPVCVWLGGGDEVGRLWVLAVVDNEAILKSVLVLILLALLRLRTTDAHVGERRHVKGSLLLFIVVSRLCYNCSGSDSCFFCFCWLGCG